MKPVKMVVLSLVLVTTAVAADPAAPASRVSVSSAVSRPPSKGAATNFTGAATMTPLFSTTTSTRAAAVSVTFDPGARTVWHSHPAGQQLVVVDGDGWVQQWGGQRQALKKGDVVWTPPGVKHWHGATTSSALTHIAVQEHVDGKVVDWMEPVTDGQYLAQEKP